ncbi:MAG: tetratricopeptide repeat protein [Terriglobia bacterium]
MPAPATIFVQDSRVGRDLVAVAGDYVVQATPPTISSLHQLPPPPRDFTGREAEIGELLGAVEKRGFSISGLQGMGGIGKTALALVLAERLSSQYSSAQIYLDLKGTSPEPLSVADAMAHVIRAYRPNLRAPEDESELRGLYQSLLHGQRVILLMDNAKDAAQVEPLIPGAYCILLVTSRQHFTLPGFYAKNLEVLSPAEAHNLLLAIACGPDAVETVSPALTPAAESARSGRARDVAAHAGEIAKLCGYLPLALRAAASALAETPDLSPTDYVQRLADTRKRLELRDPGKDQTVEASLALSYDLLSSDLQPQFSSLAVFPETFDVAAATAMWGIDRELTQEALSTLGRYSLVEWNPLSTRYRLHDMARLFADSRMTDDERDQFRGRHANHYVKVAATGSRLYVQGGEGVLGGLGLFDREWSNIQAGQTWAAERAPNDDSAARLTSDYADAAVHCLDLRQHPRELTIWLEAALAAARRLKDRAVEGSHLGNLGIALANLGEPRRAIECLEQELAIARETGNRSGEGHALGHLGNAYAALSEFRRAIEYFEQRRAIALEIGDRRGEGYAVGNLGNVYMSLGNARQAIERYEQHLVITRDTGDRRAEGSTLANLGLAYAGLGEPRRAIEYYEKALAIAREIGDRRAEGSTHGNLGRAYEDLGDPRRAMECYMRRIAIALELGDRRGEANALGNLGLALSASGEPRRSIEYHEKALVIDREIGDRKGEGNSLGNLGYTYAALGEPRLAVEYYEKALSIEREIGDRRGEGNSLGNLGNIHMALGEPRRAIECYEKALAIERGIGDRRGEGNTLWNMSLAFDRLGDRTRAIAQAEAALNVREAIEDLNAAKVRAQLAKWRGTGT